MNKYSTNIFGRTDVDADADTPLVALLVGAMCRLGAILAKASELRETRDNGGSLTHRELQFVAKADRLLEVGIEAFLQEDME